MIRWAAKTLQNATSTPRYRLITHKFYYGQGANLKLNLTHRAYNVTLQTIWEDYALAEIEGLTGVKNYVMGEEGKECFIDDSQLDSRLEEKINIRLKIPEDFSYAATLFGSMEHVYGPIPSKIRSVGTISVNMTGVGTSYKAANLQTAQLSFLGEESDVQIVHGLAGTATVNCKNFKSSKLSIAKRCDIKADSIRLQSLIMQDSESFLTSRHCEIESIMGKATIDSSSKLRIKRWYAPLNGIQADSTKYDIGVETGTGTIKGNGTITIGRLHKGGKVSLEDGTVSIVETLE